MGAKTKALRAAFPVTLPILAGYLFLGSAYGVLMASKGYGLFWTVLMSLFAFAGSAQYVAITFLTSAFDPAYALLLTVMINARHVFYGISMLGRYSGTGKLKPYLIFGMTDETFSLLASREAPPGVERPWYMFFVTLLDHGYWVAGSAVGAILGAIATFNPKGLDFVLTALFVVIFVEQWISLDAKARVSGVVGLGCALVSLVAFGPSNFIIPALVAILAALSLFRRPLGEEAA